MQLKRAFFQAFAWSSLFDLVSGAPVSSKNSSSSQTSASALPSVADWATWGVAQVPNVLNATAADANSLAKGYRVVKSHYTQNGLEAKLKLINETNIYGYDFDSLTLKVEYQSDNRLNVHIEPTDLSDVYVLPEHLAFKPKAESEFYSFSNADLVFTYEKDPFTFTILRASSGEELFSTAGNPLVFSNQFIQLNTSLPLNHTITGLGESIHGFVQEPGSVKTLFANDAGDPIDGNIYGTHPFYIDQRYDTNTTHGVYWRTSAAQEVIIEEEALTWRALSGVVDLYFFSGPTVKEVISQYVHEIGLPGFQPYWSLGYHQCRWGYSTIQELDEVVKTFKKFEIPLETIWSDIDYMDSYKDFTTDPHRYPAKEFKKFLDTIHDDHQHYVPIVDAAIYVPNPNNASDNYTVFESGNSSETFLRNPDGSLYIGAVWPGYTVFPDFFANSTQEWWTESFAEWYKTIEFDGIWLDMNEVSSFCVGSCGSENYTQNPVHPPFVVGSSPTSYPEGFSKSNKTEYHSIESSISASSASVAKTASSSSTATSTSSATLDSKNTLETGVGNINYPPYAIYNWQGNYDIATHDVSPNATHADGTLEYDVHNLYGYTQTNATYNALLEIQPNKRPFIITRSTFAGSGQWAGHWGGDNNADWQWMYFSIPQALSFGIFGIPFFGVDTCGFNGNSDSELCSRWTQLSSFFPFYRNHNVLGAISQEPYVWSDVTEAAKTSIGIRYSLLPYYYTLLQEAHTTGLPILRALSWQFPEDRSLRAADRQFFVGDALIVTPVLEPLVDTVKGVFPGSGETEVYYDWYTQEAQDFEAGFNETLDAPLGHIPLHVRGGHILPLQEPGYTIHDSRKNPFSLIVALDLDGYASGKLYLDDGESVNITESLYVDFIAEGHSLTSAAYGNFNASQPLANITILGVDSKPSNVTFLGEEIDFSFANNTLLVTDLEDYTTGGAFAEEFVLTW
ncbi:unnamed protein product [Kuraishia capsulata CBS 1993]|uniref:Uncharacterized protein n=1 Tax=Kuraishia capsulata CBS 1993 TaxID=1382522 RepID=W6MG01_9ASCO|nr:uncharacterized protein KUCA_T00000866001 [Kuraishia capsulata CBS 1993]CDK24899.1 unnamed protein product [Kuraishia capsulata CBS 1993]